MTGFYFTIHISNSLINSAIIEVRCYQSFKDTESESKSQQKFYFTNTFRPLLSIVQRY